MRQTVRTGTLGRRVGPGLAVALVVACGGAEAPAAGGLGVDDDPSVIGTPRLDAGTADAGDASIEPSDAAREVDGDLPPDRDAALADDAEAQESEDALRERLLIADARQPVLYAYDLSSAQLLATLDIDAQRLTAGSTGRYAFVSQPGGVQIVDMGLLQLPGSQGPQYRLADVQQLPLSLTGNRPGAVHAYGGQLAVFFEGGASVQVVDEAALPGALNPRVIAAGAPHVGLAIPWSGKLLASTVAAGQSEGQLQRFDATGQRETTLDCQAPSAAAVNAGALAVACSAGVLRLQVGKPSDTLPAAQGVSRITRLVAHPSAATFLAMAGESLCVVRDVLHCVDAPAGLVDVAYDASGKRALALTRAGLLHLLDASSLQDQGSFEVIAPVDDATPARALPTLAVGRQSVFVSDPAAGKVHELHASTRTVLRSLELPGAPAALLLLRYP